MAKPWYVDKGLGTLIAQVKSKHPGIVVGTIGDPAHQGGSSDHNPEANGSVDAADFMIGPHFTQADAQSLVNALTHYRDGRLSYVIWDRHIFTSAGVWERYYGTDPHTGHVHVSVNDLHENDASQWQLIGRNYTMESLTGLALPILKNGDNDSEHEGYWHVYRAQLLLKITADGVYGPATVAAVKALGYNDGTTITRAVWAKLAGLVPVG